VGEIGYVKFMKFTRISLVILAVVIFGMGFSGYLTSSVLMSNSCPLTGGCTLVLGYPSCMYGFIMYTVLLILMLLISFGTITFAVGRKGVLFVAVVGMLFSGSLLVQEYVNRSPLTICAAGFSMFLIIFLLSQLLWREV